MSAPTHTTKKDKENTSDLAELEKRLLAGFALMIQNEIEPLKSDIKKSKRNNDLTSPVTPWGAVNP